MKLESVKLVILTLNIESLFFRSRHRLFRSRCLLLLCRSNLLPRYCIIILRTCIILKLCIIIYRCCLYRFFIQGLCGFGLIYRDSHSDLLRRLWLVYRYRNATLRQDLFLCLLFLLLWLCYNILRIIEQREH